MENFKEKRNTIIDSMGLLWFEFSVVGLINSKRYVLASPQNNLYWRHSTPAYPVKNLKQNTFHKERCKQWNENWSHTWEHDGEIYTTGKCFKSIGDMLVCQKHIVPNIDSKAPCYLVFNYGKACYAFYYDNSETFKLYSVYGNNEFIGWSTHKSLQPIYKTSDLNKAL